MKLLEREQAMLADMERQDADSYRLELEDRRNNRKQRPENLGPYVRRASQRRCNQVARTLAALELLATHRFGLTDQELQFELRNAFRVCERTITRDMGLLLRLGFVVREGERLRIDPAKGIPKRFR